MDIETFPDLSPRETQLLLLASEGMTDNAISSKLGISVATVNSYWVRIRSKLGAQSRTEAVAMALRSQTEVTMRRLQTENERLAQELGTVSHPNNDGSVDPNVFRDLLQVAGDGILIVGQDGRIIASNAALSEMFGYGPEDLIGQYVSRLIPDRFRETHVRYLGEYFEAPTRRRMGHQLFTPALRRDGSEFAVGVTLGAHTTAGGNYTVCMVRDQSPELELLMKYAPSVPETAAFRKD